MLFQQGRYWERKATSVQISSTVTIWSKALNQQKEFLVAKYTDVISNFTCRLYAYNFIDTKNIVNSIKHISYKSIIHSSMQKLANPNLIQNIPNQPSKRSTPAIIWSLHLGVMHHRSIVNWIDQSLFNTCPQSLSNGSLMKKYTRRKDKLKHNHTDTLQSTQKHKILTNNMHILILYIYNQRQPWSLSQTWALQRLKLMIWCKISNTLHITSKQQRTHVTKNEYLI